MCHFAGGEVGHGELRRRVIDPLVLAAFQPQQPPRIRRPGGTRGPVRVVVGADEFADLARRAGIDGLHEHFVVGVAIGLAAILRGVSNEFPIRRPGRRPVIALARGELPRLAAPQIDDEQLLRAIVQVARAITFEQEALGLDGRRILRIAAHPQAHLCHHDRTRTIGRQVVVADASRDAGDLACAAALRGHAPELRDLVLACVAEEVQRLAVRSEARHPLAGLRRARELPGLAIALGAVGHRPEVARGLVAFPVVARQGVGDAIAGRRERWLGHRLE